MTGKQLEIIKSLRNKVSKHLRDEDRYGCELHAVCFAEAVSCIEMMNSILIYDYRPDDEEIPFPENNKYLAKYIKILGRKLTEKLWEDQVKDYREAVVGHAGQDAEGCTYNYCKWKDE